MDTFRNHFNAVRDALWYPGFTDYETENCNLSQAFANWRLEFCHSFVTRMPRELRDMTNKHLLHEEYLITVPDSTKKQTLEEVEDRVTPWLETPENDVRQLMYPADVGWQFATELAELFYRRATYDIHNPSDLHAAIHTDIFCLGLRPGKFIRGVRIHQWSKGVVTLHGLSELHRRPLLVVELVLHFCGLRMLKNFFERFAGYLFALKDSGVEIRVVRRRPDGGVGKWPQGSLWKRTPRADLSWLFHGSVGKFLMRVEGARVLADLGPEIMERDRTMGVLRRRNRVGAPPRC